MAIAGGAQVVGLDIGTSAVRAAEVSSGKHGLTLSKFGQVALPPGSVVDGEIRDAGSVSHAISTLFKRNKISNKKVVVGVANQRVVVRQVDLPYLEEKDFRSSLKFQVADHIPMPIDDAEIDYQILADYESAESGRMMRVLLVAAATDMVEQFVDTVSAAGLRPEGVDLTPFAVARAVSDVARGEVGLDGAEAIVDVGAGVTNVLVHQSGEAQFVRILLIGGDDSTQAIAEEMEVSAEEAEALKLDLHTDMGDKQAAEIVARSVGILVQEIQGSLDYYLGLDEAQPIRSVLLTGGGSLTPGLGRALEASLDMDVFGAMPLQQVDAKKTGLNESQISQVEPVAAAALGLAMGRAGR
ncbi:MAG: type IV pilus assembly protein PilM [Actinomycetota bacterium]